MADVADVLFSSFERVVKVANSLHFHSSVLHIGVPVLTKSILFFVFPLVLPHIVVVAYRVQINIKTVFGLTHQRP